MRWRLATVSVLSLLSATALRAAPVDERQQVVVVVDASRPVGTLRSLQGVNGAPAPGMHKPPPFTFGGWNMPEGVDVSRGYREARIDLVRTHDAYGPGDIDARFGPPRSTGEFTVPPERNALVIFPDAGADPEDPRSYQFGPTDRLVASIVGIGAQAIFRLGRSETSVVTPPRDLDRYASIAAHIVRHYNRGWDHGFHYGLKYWEIWNEPDLDQLFWGGTPRQFYALYARLARAVKRADPTALVGGPTLAKPNVASPFREGFLQFVRAQRVPLDFFSWHWYTTDSGDPREFGRIAREVRALLDRSGFPHTLSVLDEWNYGLVYPLPSDLERAAFVASSLIDMAHGPVDLAALYRADNLFGADGATPGKTGAALIALGRMEETGTELAVTQSSGGAGVALHAGADPCGFAVEAGRSADGRTIQILLSHYEIPARYRKPPQAGLRCASIGGYDLSVEHLASGARFSIERYRISERRTLALAARTEKRGATIRIDEALPAPGVELVVLRRADPP